MTDSELSTEKIVQSYFNQKNILNKHQIDSFNDFMDNILPNILEQHSHIIINVNTNNIHTVEFELLLNTLNIEPPKYNENNGVENILYPDLARCRNYSYSSLIFINILVTIKVIENESIINLPSKKIENVLIGNIPIMVGSKYCSYTLNNKKHNDMGGYFIINGNEKVIISQEKIANNIIQIFNSKNVSYSYVCEIRSVNDNKFSIPKLVSIKITNNSDIYNNNIYINIPNIKNSIPIIILFRLFGTISDKDILNNIITNDGSVIDKEIKKILLPSFYKANDIRSEVEAYQYIIKNLNNHLIFKDNDKKIEYINENIKKNIFPHLDNDKKKSLYIGLMINKLLRCYLKIDNITDRDSYIHKRIETPGALFGNLTYLCYNKMFKDFKTSIYSEYSSITIESINNNLFKINTNNIHKFFKITMLESSLKSSLSTGNWGIKTNNFNKTGVSQVLNRLTYASSISHLRRVSCGGDLTGKLIPPRKLHATSWGYLCPSETPEGHSIGLVKNLACSCEITIQCSSIPIRRLIKNKIIDINDIDILTFDKSITKILINGDWIGFTNELDKLYDYLILQRENGLINIYVSFYIDYKNNTFYIYTDRGRYTRPLLKIKNGKLLYNIDIQNNLKNGKLKWDNIILNVLDNKCIINYIDTYEINNKLVANYINKISDKKYTHCEINPSLILGIMASCIPFANHNQSPRNTYQSAMGKQAIGIYSKDYNKRFDTFSHILHYPQKPIVNTSYINYFDTSSLPNGINVTVAIASYGGYNQEDSVILNRGSIERGLFNSTFYRTYKEEENKNQLTGDEDRFCKPDINKILFPKNSNYDKLESDGFVKENTYIDDNDIIIGKIIPIKHKEYNYKDTSISIKNHESGYIDKNYININGDGFKFCKIRIRSTKIPDIGDKFSSRHGQKGTVGMIYDQCDMPFSKDGITPDIIINPHAVPSRMTIAQLLECILGKACTINGYYGDATSFNNINVNDISSKLEDLNFEKHGNEVLYSGINGEQMHTNIFIGPTYYQRLKHMSSDKMHSRSSGPVVSMTRQPSEGRASHGGLRFGEMERDCMIAHGAPNFLQERLMKVSDEFTCFICNKCGMICTSIINNNEYECKKCNNYYDFSKIVIPYSCKLLFQELQSMSIVCKFQS